jgi:hypothetical protein
MDENSALMFLNGLKQMHAQLGMGNIVLVVMIDRSSNT